MSGRLLFSIFLINALSLVLQMVWVRRLMTVFGSTALTVSTVFAVFLAGIALGGYLGGRLIGRFANGLRAGAVLLIGLGGYCWLSLVLFNLIRFPYATLTREGASPVMVMGIKFTVAFLILLPPTTVIGFMFPAVSRLLAPRRRLQGREVSATYAADTLGAALGALVTAIFLVPKLGLLATTLIAGAGYAGLGGWWWWASRSPAREGPAPKPVREPPPPPDAPASTPLAGLVLAGFFCSGFAALVCEVTWTRFFQLLYGSNLFAVALVVASFLLGLGLGSYLIRPWIDRIRNPLRWFAYLELGLALATLLVLKTDSVLEAMYLGFRLNVEHFGLFHALLGCAAFGVLAVPTILMGMNFPLAVRILSDLRGREERDVGIVFGINTAGGILGSVLAGFLIIPLLGLERSVWVPFVCYGLLALAFAAGATPRRHWHLGLTAGLLVLAGVFLRPGWWAPLDQNMAVWYHGSNFASAQEFFRTRAQERVVFSQDSPYSQVQIVEATGNPQAPDTLLYLRMNGKTDASNFGTDMAIQLMLGYLPLLHHPGAQDVCVIGLGGGYTLRAVTRFPRLRSITQIELDPVVLQASRRYFSQFTGHALDDPRVRVVIDDGRNFLFRTGERFDLITQEPSNIWLSGVSALYTDECFAQAATVLRPGGLYCVWMPLYELGSSDVKIILKTLKRHFAQVQGWVVSGEMLLLASQEPVRFNRAYARDALQDSTMFNDISRHVQLPERNTILNFLAQPQITDADAEAAAAEAGIPLSTDDLPYLEFSSYYARFHGKPFE